MRLLREIRGAIAALDGKFDGKIDSLDRKIDRNHEELQKRIDSLRQATLGESVLGRYATAEFDERLAAPNSVFPHLKAAGDLPNSSLKTPQLNATLTDDSGSS